MPISGEDMLKRHVRSGWVVMHRKGSHVKGGFQNLRETIPLHKELARGLAGKLMKRLQKTSTDKGDAS
jgi:predicted RNA binding protein YcfA (HicA-like mRNA interferase family)